MAGPLSTRLARRETVADGVVDLVFDVVSPRPFSFQGGQFVTLSVGTDPSGQQIRRSYSLASASDDGEHLRFLIKLIPGGVASNFFDALSPGSPVDMTGPHGFFVLDKEHAGDVVFAATGTGLAPMFPMLGEIAKRKEPGRRSLYWGLRSESDLFAVREVEELCHRSSTELFIYLTRPSDRWTGLSGRITQPILDRLPGLERPTFYMVGNGAMIRELKEGLQARGVERKKQIRTEAFFD